MLLQALGVEVQVSVLGSCSPAQPNFLSLLTKPPSVSHFEYMGDPAGRRRRWTESRVESTRPMQDQMNHHEYVLATKVL